MGRALGELQLLVLLAILRLEDGAYAVSIAEEIRRETGRGVARATIYVTIRRLEERGLVKTWLGDPIPERGGKARRYVRVEPAGMEAIAAVRSSFERMSRDLDRGLSPG